jgi:DMSO/TMAO reductase YedYZ molybdopterin-dependent catalytic subunit
MGLHRIISQSRSQRESCALLVVLDLLTARHPQTLLATHHNGQPLIGEHGAPLRLIAPMKLGLKNIKAITRITYVKDEPKDYWAERGYSRYDGI